MKQSIVGSVVAVAAFAGGMALFFSGLPVSAQGGGSISGEVKFTGAAPAPKVVKVNKDNEVCGQEKKIVEVAVGPGGGLGETLVSVAAKGAKPTPAKPAVLDQKGCEFHPDIVVMAPGEIKILNSDGVLHNIHTFSTANPPINKAQPKFKKEMEALVPLLEKHGVRVGVQNHCGKMVSHSLGLLRLMGIARGGTTLINGGSVSTNGASGGFGQNYSDDVTISIDGLTSRAPF